jgi:hypothetical protein
MSFHLVKLSETPGIESPDTCSRATEASLTATPEEHACAFACEHSRERVKGESKKGKRESVLFIGTRFSNLDAAVDRKERRAALLSYTYSIDTIT